MLNPNAFFLKVVAQRQEPVVKSATFAPKITPKPSDDEPSSAAVMPIESSGRMATIPEIIKL